jgi:hypothetical protein
VTTTASLAILLEIKGPVGERKQQKVGLHVTGVYHFWAAEGWSRKGTTGKAYIGGVRLDLYFFHIGFFFSTD